MMIMIELLALTVLVACSGFGISYVVTVSPLFLPWQNWWLRFGYEHETDTIPPPEEGLEPLVLVVHDEHGDPVWVGRGGWREFVAYGARCLTCMGWHGAWITLIGLWLARSASVDGLGAIDGVLVWIAACGLLTAYTTR